MVDFTDNSEAFAHAKTFGDSELLGFFKQAEKERWYGTLYHHPNKHGVAEYTFQEGKCLRCIEPIKGTSNTFNKSTKF